MTETRNSSVKQKPHIPTINRMKKPPVSRGPAREPGCRQGTIPPLAAVLVVLACINAKTKAVGFRPRLRWYQYNTDTELKNSVFQMSP